MRNVICFEETIPTAEPLVVRGVQYEHLVFRPASCGATGLRHLTASYMFEGNVIAIFPDPMVTAMFFVCEKSGWGMLAES